MHNKLPIFYLFTYLFASLLCGCSHKNANTEKEASNKTDTIVLKWMGHWKKRAGKEQIVRDIAKEYEFINQQTKVHLEFPQDIANSESYRGFLADHYVEMINTGNVDWDIVFLDRFLYDDVGKRLNDPMWGPKYLVNFDEFEWFKQSHKPFLLTDPYYRNLTGGIHIGPIQEGDFMSLWFNKALAEKIGLDIKNTGMKYEDLKEYFRLCNEYNQKNTDKITLICYDAGYGESSPTMLLNTLVMSELNVEDTAHRDFSTNLSLLQKGLEALEELATFDPLNRYSETSGGADLFLKNKCMFGIYPSWAINKWMLTDKQNTENLFPAEMPVFNKDGKIYPGAYQSVFAVFKSSPHKDQAVDLLKYWCKQDVAERWLYLTKNPTGIKVRLNSSSLTQDKFDMFLTTIDNKYGGNVSYYSLATLLFGNKNKNLNLHAADILKGDLTAKEALNIISHELVRR
jgi:ABC-type glycerol-3-phosphate transport system substrate-binding protein